ncbi:MAG: hypothetical protein V3T83_18640 [Acidobacteriota bacterium]
MLKIHSVNSVTLAVLDTNPRKMLITAVGQVVSSGWAGPQLVEYSPAQPPRGGLIDFDFLASPPSGTALPALYPMIAHTIWDGPMNQLRGVRLHAASNLLEQLLPQKVTVHPALGDFSEIRRLAGRKLSAGLPESALLAPDESPPKTPAQNRQPGILLGGNLQSEPPIGGGEGTGLYLYDVMVEVDASQVSGAEDLVGDLAVVEGQFELKSSSRRGKAWTFVATDIRPHQG